MEERGMGFITPSDGSEDLFVHRSFLSDGQSLIVGAQVAFNPDYDTQKDKLVARNVRGAINKGAGKGVPGPPMYVQPPPPQLDAGSAAAIVHQALSASVHDLGVDVATLLAIAGYRKVVDPPQQRASPYGSVVATPPSGPPPHTMWPPAAQQPGPPVGGRVFGVVKSWIEERGMGFVSPSAGGEDHFVHRSFIADGNSLPIGSTIQFEPGWDVQKNKPVAKNITGAVTVSAPTAPPVYAQAPINALMPQIVPASAVPASIQNAVPPHAQALEGVQIGTVKAWYDTRGMGFISPNAGGADHFIHRSNLTDGNALREGAQVFFESSVDPMKGKPIAMNVSGAFMVEGGVPLQ